MAATRTVQLHHAAALKPPATTVASYTAPSSPTSTSSILTPSTSTVPPRADSVLSSAPPMAKDQQIPCPLSFLGCVDKFARMDLRAWETHTRAHFFGNLPSQAQCPFADCEQSFICSTTGGTSHAEAVWNARLAHIVARHSEAGQGTLLVGSLDTTEKPDSGLVDHLWRTGVVKNVEYKELKMGGKLSGGVSMRYERGRKERDERRGMR